MVVTTIYNFGMTNGAEIMGSDAMVFTGIIWVISIFLVVYSWSLLKKGVLV